jgi:L-threonylcarbamoyladenylate synthase
MVTNVYNSKTNKNEAISQAILALKSNEAIVFPTETVYGIGACIFDVAAVEKVFQIKNRPLDKPMAAHVSSLEQVQLLSDNIPDLFYHLAERFLPGPLSLIIPKNENISDVVTAGFKTIGIRFPSNEVCREIIDLYGAPLAATSANISGGSSPQTAIDALTDLDGLVSCVIDDGATTFRKDSTVLDISGSSPRLLREGVISKIELEDFLGCNI